MPPLRKVICRKNSPLRYMTSAIIAGFFIVVAIILSNITAAVFYKSSPELSKFLGSILFPIAIILIVFVGGDLFTGNNMTMAFGLYNNKVKFSSALRVCIMSYIGNFIGTFILGGLLVLSGCASEVLTDYYSAIIPGKLELDPLTLFIRGVLCNYLVCLAVFIGTRMKTESGKLVVMFCIITAFVIAGFEHCIANMGIFTIAAFLLGGLPTQEVINNFIFVTLGNIFGGTILFALPLQIVTKKITKMLAENQLCKHFYLFIIFIICFRHKFFCKDFNSLKGFCTYNMLYSASILNSSFFIDTKTHKPSRNPLMTLIHSFSNFFPLSVRVIYPSLSTLT